MLTEYRFVDTYHQPNLEYANYTFLSFVQRPDTTVTFEDIPEFRADLLRYFAEQKIESLST